MSEAISTMLHLLLLDQANHHGLEMRSVRCDRAGKFAEIRIKFADGMETSVGTKIPDDDDRDQMSMFLDLANSTRGKFQLWTSPKRTREYQGGLAKMAAKLGNVAGARKISTLAKNLDPGDFVTRKVGRTPGGRTYEVVDGPWGRRTVVVDEAIQTACQRGPFVKSATRIYKLTDPGGLNGNTSRAKGWVRRARLYSDQRTKCRFLEAFCDSARRTPISIRLEGTHDPAAVHLRARRLAKLATSISSGQVLPEYPCWKKKHKLAFPLEHDLFKKAWSLSYYEDSVHKAVVMFVSVVKMFQNDERKWQQLSDRFEEII